MEPFWQLSLYDAFKAAQSTPNGLTGPDAAKRLATNGPNELGGASRASTLELLLRQFDSPIVLILVFATILAGALGDVTDSLIILAIIAVSGFLGFWQERGATRAVESLLAVVQVKAEVLRDGQVAQIPVKDVVTGDVVALNAGDVIPGDCLVVESNALQTDEAALTGETYPAEKQPGQVAPDAPIAKRTNEVFFGTHVASGSGHVLVMRTAADTEFGQVAGRLKERPPQTGFERGMTQFGLLLVRVIAVLVVAIFVVNVLLQRPLVDAALFSLALAVGLTPQLLPTIVTISLSQGAQLMAKKRVIVKRLDSIEDFGAMSLLCTDKTGTMTIGEVELAGALGVDGQPSQLVRRAAFLNASLQTGFSNPIDEAIVQAGGVDATNAHRIDELPYDFTRRRLSVLVDDNGTVDCITKGSLADVLAVSTTAQNPDGSTVDIATVREQIQDQFTTLSAQGLRVLGVASRPDPGAGKLNPTDESGLTFLGLLTFLDPPKPGVDATLRDLNAAGISVRMITGDNRLVGARVAQLVGLDPSHVLTGSDLGTMDDKQLAAQVDQTHVFAEIEPVQKERIIRAYRATGRIVGYMGDGINDAPALHAADVGISVDTGVDVAKQSAAIVLLDKDLRVLLDGVRQGRRTFANTLKYVSTTTSASFGNVLSMAIASAILPFLPLLADQILLVNFLTDIPATTIATDNVDPERLAAPQTWDLRYIRNFMIVFGAVSSAFDLITFAVLRLGFNADAQLFRSGWFVESVLTELAVLFVLRTRRLFFQSQPSRLLIASSVALALVTIAIPYSFAGQLLDLPPLPGPLLVTLLVITALYIVATEIAKQLFLRRIAVAAQAVVATV
jgi:Mg2+-importing ATPase